MDSFASQPKAGFWLLHKQSLANDPDRYQVGAGPVRNNGQQTVGRLNQATVLGHKGKAVYTSKTASASGHIVTVPQHALRTTRHAWHPRILILVSYLVLPRSRTYAFTPVKRETTAAQVQRSRGTESTESPMRLPVYMDAVHPWPPRRVADKASTRP